MVHNFPDSCGMCRYLAPDDFCTLPPNKDCPAEEYEQEQEDEEMYLDYLEHLYGEKALEIYNQEIAEYQSRNYQLTFKP